MPTVKAPQTVVCAVLLGFAATANSHDNGNYMQALQESLVSWSASDFATHGPHPEKVRNVHVRYAENDNGARTYVLCGQFVPANGDDARWTQFATIKTAPYEQWIGGQAEAFCERALPVSVGDEDLSAMLLAKLSSSPVIPSQS